ncbi:circularly permuted type 2 ATP-grasp protein [Georgenia faecalis]|uniref:Circularly permuted type 2 ATP-grasp protein n=1 Tax=Georgenia faecalis TaxID=2483799 RepID=A0ABV9D8L2_9MICO|nr:circularly permuted type 2 ATP-grasp protein [Georgenia faecalis]
MTDLLATYSAAGPGHDEMLQATGAARVAWERLAAGARLGSGQQLTAHAEEVATLLADHGVPDGGWALDPLPVLLDEAEWTQLEGAIRQRSELLDEILTDLYGPRRLLTAGLLPPELVLSHRGFVRAADGIRVPGRHQLFCTGADLARNADGSWAVMSVRSQAPVGMGYAMEGRRALAQVLAGLYRGLRIRRIGPFFRDMLEHLRAVAPSGSDDDPRIALLTAGPTSPAAFDEGYLASMLGIPLVQPEDLLVEDGRVWARGLGQRQAVDVLLRRVDAEDCDPLELHGGRGTPGLLHAARTGAVTIVNPLGSGVLENPALLTYLPRLSRALRGEDLALGSAVTYWCGERSMCSHVIANLGRLVIKPTSPHRHGSAVRGWELTNDQRADLAVQIAAQPWAWVGQEPVEASTTPTVHATGLAARPTVLRTFAVASADGYQVMPGALGTVVAPGPSARRTDIAKDVWILATEPLRATPSGRPEPVLRRPAEPTGISPRAAGDLLELGRWTERAEGTVRLLRAVVHRREDDAGEGGADVGAQALDVLHGALREVTADLPLSQLITEAGTRGTIAHAVGRMSRAAASARDHLSPDTWLALSSLERTLQRERRRDDGDAGLGLVPTLGRLLEGLLALGGVYAESMVHDVGWSFLEVGRRVERAHALVVTLGPTVTTRRPVAVEALVLESVLMAHESVLTHRRRYASRPPLPGTLALLLHDTTNPHGLAFQLARLAELLADLPGANGGARSRDQLLVDVVDLLTELPTTALAEDAGGARTHLAESLEAMAWRLRALEAEVRAVHLASPRSARWSAEAWA